MHKCSSTLAEHEVGGGWLVLGREGALLWGVRAGPPPLETQVSELSLHGHHRQLRSGKSAGASGAGRDPPGC